MVPSLLIKSLAIMEIIIELRNSFLLFKKLIDLIVETTTRNMVQIGD